MKKKIYKKEIYRDPKTGQFISIDLATNLQKKNIKKLPKWTNKEKLNQLTHDIIESNKFRLENGQILKNLRVQSGFGVRRMSNATGIPQSTIEGLERGKFFNQVSVDKILDSLANKIELAYVSGLIDRHCAMFIYKASPKANNTRTNVGYEVRIIFTSKFKILPDLLVKVFGVGRTGRYTQTFADGSQTIRWVYQAFHSEAEVVLKKIAPFIKVKKAMVDLLLKLRKVQIENKSLGGIGKAGVIPGYYEECEKIYQEFRTMKELVV